MGRNEGTQKGVTGLGDINSREELEWVGEGGVETKKFCWENWTY